MTPEHEQRFQILALSGGGFRGLYQVQVLCALEQKAGRPIARAFDLLAGTSVGGLIAMALSLEVPADRIRTAFEKHGPSVFSKRPPPRSGFGRMAALLRNAGKPKYTDAGLRRVIEEIIPSGTLLGQALHPVVIPAVNLSKGRPQVFKTPHHPRFERDHRESMCDVALATAAAPTFFPVATVRDELFADGGLCANAPDLVALHEAETFFGAPVANAYVLSIGTTTSAYAFSHSTPRTMGLAQWLANGLLLDVMFASQAALVADVARHRLGPRYVRIDSEQSSAQAADVGLDVATDTAQRVLRGLADSRTREFIGTEAVVAMIAHVASDHRFHYGPRAT